MSNICEVCGKPLWNDGNWTYPPDLCKGHSAPVSQSSFIITPDYSLVLERIATALEDIAIRLGYLRSIAK